MVKLSYKWYKFTYKYISENRSSLPWMTSSNINCWLVNAKKRSGNKSGQDSAQRKETIQSLYSWLLVLFDIIVALESGLRELVSKKRNKLKPAAHNSNIRTVPYRVIAVWQNPFSATKTANNHKLETSGIPTTEAQWKALEGI